MTINTMQHVLGNSLLLPAYERVGQGQCSLTAHFAKRNTKNCGGEKRSDESEGGQKFLPPNPLPFCPPERKSFCSCRAKLGNQNSQSGFSSKKVRILTKRHRILSKSQFWANVASPRSGGQKIPLHKL